LETWRIGLVFLQGSAHLLDELGSLLDTYMRKLLLIPLFMPAYRALDHTIKTVISAVTSKYPKSKSGNVGSGFSPNINSYHAWYYLNNKLNPANTKFWIRNQSIRGGFEYA
jgi:hypothetical protein